MRVCVHIYIYICVTYSILQINLLIILVSIQLSCRQCETRWKESRKSNKTSKKPKYRIGYLSTAITVFLFNQGKIKKKEYRSLILTSYISSGHLQSKVDHHGVECVYKKGSNHYWYHNYAYKWRNKLSSRKNILFVKQVK